MLTVFFLERRLKLLSACLLCAQSGQPLDSLDAGGVDLLHTRDALLREVKAYISPSQVPSSPRPAPSSVLCVSVWVSVWVQIIRENRLEDLVAQALRQQQSQTPSKSLPGPLSRPPGPVSLLQDCVAAPPDSHTWEASGGVPDTPLRVLRGHTDEVQEADLSC